MSHLETKIEYLNNQDIETFKKIEDSILNKGLETSCLDSNFQELVKEVLKRNSDKYSLREYFSSLDLAYQSRINFLNNMSNQNKIEIYSEDNKQIEIRINILKKFIDSLI